jgi:hypothetical protein
MILSVPISGAIAADARDRLASIIGLDPSKSDGVVGKWTTVYEEGSDRGSLSGLVAGEFVLLVLLLYVRKSSSNLIFHFVVGIPCSHMCFS